MVTRVPTRNHQLQSFWAAPIPTMAMNARKTIPWVGNCRPATAHAALWSDVSNNVETFFADLRDHGKAENTLLFMFSEFGRRIFDNGSVWSLDVPGVANSI